MHIKPEDRPDIGGQRQDGVLFLPITVDVYLQALYYISVLSDQSISPA